MPGEESQTYSVRLPASAIPITEGIIKLHYQLKHIPEPTPSAYLKFLVMQDTQGIIDEIHKRRSRVTG